MGGKDNSKASLATIFNQWASARWMTEITDEIHSRNAYLDVSSVKGWGILLLARARKEQGTLALKQADPLSTSVPTTQNSRSDWLQDKKGAASLTPVPHLQPITCPSESLSLTSS